MELLPNGIELRFHPDEDYFPTWPEPLKPGKFETPCFVNRGFHKFADDVEYKCVGYQLYFTENPAIGLCGMCRRSRPLGYHPDDVEGLYVLFDPTTEQPCQVYFKAHGLGQGSWLPWEDCLKTEDGAVVVYVALNSHALYSSTGTIRRIWGFANDRVGDGGKRIHIGVNNAVKAERLKIGRVVIEDRIPKISNTSISDRERRNLAIVNERIRNRA